jgi:hypothetical protein
MIPTWLIDLVLGVVLALAPTADPLTVSDDFSPLTLAADHAWERIEAVSTLEGCATAPDIEWQAGAVGGYRIADETVIVGNGRPDVELQTKLIHEMGHHLDFACDAQGTIGAALRAAQDIPADTPWFGQGPSTSWPAEYFANAVLIATGGNTAHNVNPETVALVAEWMNHR